MLCSKACWEPPWGQGRVPDGAGQAWGGGTDALQRGPLPRAVTEGAMELKMSLGPD